MQTMVFYVSENVSDLMNVASILERRFQVLTMSSAEKMFALLKKRQPSVILMDIELREMSGADAVAELKKTFEYSKIPVIFLTESVDDEIREDALRLGAQDVLRKADISGGLLNIVKKYEDGSAKNSVLAVDDQETGLSALADILSDDYIVYTADNGHDAIDAAAKYLPDVILLDVLMLDMDGYEVIKELKKSEKTKDIPVIFITVLSNAEDEEKGLLLGAADYITKPFSPAIVKLRVRNQMKILEHLETIRQLSMVDQLTALPNRRSFEERIALEWGRIIRNSTVLGILLVDVDNFKVYNDTYGHQQGDTALKALAALLEKSAMRSTDFSARWGGEEFVVLLPGTDANGLLKFAETLRKNVEDMVVDGPNGLQTKLTVSIGANIVYKGSSVSSVDELISGADMALYEAKKAGRNRVCYHKNRG